MFCVIFYLFFLWCDAILITSGGLKVQVANQ